jgi:hypothetical protein
MRLLGACSQEEEEEEEEEESQSQGRKFTLMLRFTSSRRTDDDPITT